jgi:hypothetical protein
VAPRRPVVFDAHLLWHQVLVDIYCCDDLDPVPAYGLGVGNETLQKAATWIRGALYGQLSAPEIFAIYYRNGR